MLIPVTEVVVKSKKLTDIGKIMEEIKKVREANPNRTIKVSIEISLKD